MEQLPVILLQLYCDGNQTICCYQGFNLAVELLPWKQSLRTNKDLLTLIACLSSHIVLSSTELFNYQQALLLTLKSKCDINTTPMVVNSDLIVYMCMEVIICQSLRSLESLMTSQIPSIGGTSNHIRWEKECRKNSPSFLGEFCKTLPTQNHIPKPPKLLKFRPST